MFKRQWVKPVQAKACLYLPLFLPRRWRIKYGVEIGFVGLLIGIVVYADVNSSNTFKAYEAPLARGEAEIATSAVEAGKFDRSIRVYAFQWGFVFLDEKGDASRNAVRVEPGQRVLLSILTNDVIHGMNIPVAKITTEMEPGETRQIWFRAPNRPGKYLIQCLNYCGLGHSQMKAWLVVGDGKNADHV